MKAGERDKGLKGFAYFDFILRKTNNFATFYCQGCGRWTRAGKFVKFYWLLIQIAGHLDKLSSRGYIIGGFFPPTKNNKKLPCEEDISFSLC